MVTCTTPPFRAAVRLNSGVSAQVQLVNSSDKKSRELSTFREFVERAGLGLDASSATNRNPPEPDILCLDNDRNPHAFELVELCDSEIAQLYGQRALPSASAMFVGGPDYSKVERKLTNNYVTTATPHLLCYADGRTVAPDELLVAELREIDFSKQSNFSTVWFMGEKQVLQLFSAR